jgi:serine/threonine protein kinase
MKPIDARPNLARLIHPNIAGVFGAGFGPDGTPYFVMELVDGMSGRIPLEAR